MTSPGTYLLLWKGRQSGPFSLEQIHAKLASGEISRMHQIRVDDAWQILDEFLEKLRSAQNAVRLDEHRRKTLDLEASAEGQRPKPESESSALAEPDKGSRTGHISGLAVAALILALGNFIPYVKYVAWILALVFGHTALVRMKHDARLDGRWLALAGLVVTYFFVVLASTYILLMVVHRQNPFQP